MPKKYWTGECAADACAAGDSCQIGGFLRFDKTNIWFPEKFTFTNFEDLLRDVGSNCSSFHCVQSVSGTSFSYLLENIER